MTRLSPLHPVLSKLIACAGIFLSLTAARVADAGDPAPPPPPAAMPVDVHVNLPPPPHRFATIEWNPLSLFVDRLSLTAVIVPGDHHALVLTPFYTWATTAEFSTGLNADGTPLLDSMGNAYELNVPPQHFNGFGGEIGYRYYLAEGGPRGFFGGASVILAAMTAKAYNGSETSFGDLGLALDAGYEALIADTIAVSLGGGAQYTLVGPFGGPSIPPQQLPASIVANQRLYPRVLLSFGYAF
jgi:hypothetical protein